jgi:hypothetical protein
MPNTNYTWEHGPRQWRARAWGARATHAASVHAAGRDLVPCPITIARLTGLSKLSIVYAIPAICCPAMYVLRHKDRRHQFRLGSRSLCGWLE